MPSENRRPTFPSTQDGRREVAEDAAANGAIGAPVVATDLNAGDSAVNDPLAYSLSGTDAASFTIDAGSGQLRVGPNVELDFEGKRTYRVTVQVTDGRNRKGDDDNDAIDDTITVTNVNEAPIVTGEATASLEENDDAGYFAASHLAECDRRGQQVVVSEARQRFLKDPYHKDRFTYDEHSDSFRCPQGQTLAFVRIQHVNGVPLRLYRAAGAICQACPALRACTKAKEIGRSLAIGPHDEVLRRHHAWMSTAAAKEAQRLRKQLVEPVFGIIKEQQGARRFLLRGLSNVTAEWTSW